MTQRHPDSDDDTYVTVGRPFEQLETAEDIHKAKVRKEREHYVTDSEGRRRFHGAFTGGFSAGYYNTVGSKEGEFVCASMMIMSLASVLHNHTTHLKAL